MNKDLTKAQNCLQTCNYTCVVVKGEQVYTSTERGVKPLLTWLDTKTDLAGFSAADKVIGNGAAMLYVLLDVKEIYAPIISKAAKHTLVKHGIEVHYNQCVEGIRNRANTGLCPMENAVEGIEEPEQALLAIRKRLASITNN